MCTFRMPRWHLIGRHHVAYVFQIRFRTVVFHERKRTEPARVMTARAVAVQNRRNVLRECGIRFGVRFKRAWLARESQKRQRNRRDAKQLRGAENAG